MTKARLKLDGDGSCLDTNVVVVISRDGQPDEEILLECEALNLKIEVGKPSTLCIRACFGPNGAGDAVDLEFRISAETGEALLWAVKNDTSKLVETVGK
jgi:hypothetical protein